MIIIGLSDIFSDKVIIYIATFCPLIPLPPPLSLLHISTASPSLPSFLSQTPSYFRPPHPSPYLSPYSPSIIPPYLSPSPSVSFPRLLIPLLLQEPSQVLCVNFSNSSGTIYGPNSFSFSLPPPLSIFLFPPYPAPSPSIPNSSCFAPFTVIGIYIL